VPLRTPFILGLLLIAVGVALPLLAVRGEVSDQGLTPFDVAADLSGAPVKVEFSAQRTGGYEAFVAMKWPPDATKKPDGYGCLLESPSAELGQNCRTQGKLAVTVSLTDIGGKPQNISPSYALTSYDIIGGSEITAKQELGFFNAVAGQRYIVTAHIKSDDPTIRRLKPRLTAFVNDPGIYESIALSRLVLDAAWILCAAFLAAGIPIAIITRPRKRKP